MGNLSLSITNRHFKHKSIFITEKGMIDLPLSFYHVIIEEPWGRHIFESLQYFWKKQDFSQTWQMIPTEPSVLSN